MNLDATDAKALRALLDRKLRFKYLLDRGVAALALPFLLATTLVAWIGMSLEGCFDPGSRGPLFYTEERWTAGEPFQILKFRSTFVESQAAGEVGQLTRTGRALKKWYLDELPQLVNILRGEMTVVGPRPNVPHKALREIELEGMQGKRVLRAGLTGLVQVYKREARDRERYRSLEEKYLAEVLRRSPLQIMVYDLGLILRTVPLVLRGEGL